MGTPQMNVGRLTDYLSGCQAGHVQELCLSARHAQAP